MIAFAPFSLIGGETIPVANLAGETIGACPR